MPELSSSPDNDYEQERKVLKAAESTEDQQKQRQELQAVFLEAKNLGDRKARKKVKAVFFKAKDGRTDIPFEEVEALFIEHVLGEYLYEFENCADTFPFETPRFSGTDIFNNLAPYPRCSERILRAVLNLLRSPKIGTRFYAIKVINGACSEHLTKHFRELIPHLADPEIKISSGAKSTLTCLLHESTIPIEKRREYGRTLEKELRKTRAALPDEAQKLVDEILKYLEEVDIEKDR